MSKASTEVFSFDTAMLTSRSLYIKCYSLQLSTFIDLPIKVLSILNTKIKVLPLSHIQKMSKQFGPKDYDAEKGKVYSLIINCIQRL